MPSGARAARLLLLLLAPVLAAGCSALGSDRDDPAVRQTSRALIGGQSAGGVQPAGYEQPEGPAPDEGFTLRDLDPANAARAWKKLTGRGSSRQAAQQVYRRADAEFRQAAEARRAGQPAAHRFLQAAKAFQQAAKRWPNSALEEDALFMAAESYFFADRYPKANEQYALLLKEYPNTRHLDTVSVRKFVIGKYFVDLDRAKPQSFPFYNFTDPTRPGLGTFGYAVKILDKIRLDDPTGKLADDATMAVGNAFFEKGKFIDAGERYEDLIRTFPNSEHQFTAHLLALKAKLESYQGPAYDADPLKKAEKLLRQIRKQFPREADKHQEYLRRADAEIRFRKAERQMRSARYYDRRGAYGAARFYYDILARQYADTPFGQQASQRLAQIQGKPAEPPQRLSWLVNLFPKPKQAKPLIPTGSPRSILR